MTTIYWRFVNQNSLRVGEVKQQHETRKNSVSRLVSCEHLVRTQKLQRILVRFEDQQMHQVEFHCHLHNLINSEDYGFC